MSGVKDAIKMSEQKTETVQDLAEVVYNLFDNIFDALTKINNEEDYDVSESLDDIAENLKVLNKFF